MGEARVEILDRTICYQGFFRIDRYRLRHRLFSGEWGPELVREVFERGHAAAVLPYDPQRDEVVLIEQFRVGALGGSDDPWLVEIVAGMIEPDETPEAVVRREAIEESGCHIAELVPICDYFVSPGGTTERLALFCGRVNASEAGGTHGLAEEHEDIRVVVMAAAEAFEQISSGGIKAAAPIIALQWLQLNREALRRRWGSR
jgi:ADP-ribose pyrophosphatase